MQLFLNNKQLEQLQRMVNHFEYEPGLPGCVSEFNEFRAFVINKWESYANECYDLNVLAQELALAQIFHEIDLDQQAGMTRYNEQVNELACELNDLVRKLKGE